MITGRTQWSHSQKSNGTVARKDDLQYNTNKQTKTLHILSSLRLHIRMIRRYWCHGRQRRQQAILVILHFPRALRFGRRPCDNRRPRHLNSSPLSHRLERVELRVVSISAGPELTDQSPQNRDGRRHNGGGELGARPNKQLPSLVAVITPVECGHCDCPHDGSASGAGSLKVPLVFTIPVQFMRRDTCTHNTPKLIQTITPIFSFNRICKCMRTVTGTVARTKSMAAE